MKTILWLKRFDLLMQFGALSIPIALALGTGEYFALFYTYFFVGGAQVVSFIAHVLGGRQQWSGPGRTQYGRLLTLTLALAIVVPGLSYLWPELGPIALCLGFLYLLATPIMAVWYFIICFQEEGSVARAADREMLIVRSV